MAPDFSSAWDLSALFLCWPEALWAEGGPALPHCFSPCVEQEQVRVCLVQGCLNVQAVLHPRAGRVMWQG